MHTDLQEKEKQFIVLAQRMTRIFCLGISRASPGQTKGSVTGWLGTNPVTGVSFGTSAERDEDEDAVNYVTAVKSQWVNETYGTVFPYVQSLHDPELGDAIFHVPNHDFQNYVGLYMHTGDPNQSFIRENIKDACGATVVTAPIANQRLTKTFKKRTRKNDIILNSVGYVLCPAGDGTLLTVAYQLNVGDHHSNMDHQTFEDWKVWAGQEICNRIANIQFRFQP